ncbi:flagellin N-terminal helical domain-containing protein [Thalassovita aquimarina]|uniref:flagellin N-terminal helical domain-containing protein n=1 Tax=Thalassovita aquimarina TaxID=2785917 RepID=UPI00356B176E
MTTINTNIGALSAQATMSRVNMEMQTSMERLSSGLRINAASDDAAGMAIAEKMTAQIKGLGQAVRNATDGKNLVDTTEGAHVEISNMLQRLRELSIQSANDTNTSSDRQNLALEGTQLITEINRVAKDTTFNGMKILDGSFNGKQLQIGADAGQTISIDVDSAAATDIGAHTVNTSVSLASGVGDTGIAAGNAMTITGYAGSSTITSTAGQSAKDLADAINAVKADTGVEATAVTNAKLSGLTGATTVSFDLNGISIGSVNISDSTDLSSLKDAINNQSGQTGVTAKMGANNSEIIMTDKEGNDIELTNYTTADAGATTLDMTALNADGTDAGATAGVHVTTLAAATTDGYVTGQVSMTSTKSFSVGSVNVTPGASFFEAAGNSSALDSVAEIDLSTADGASNAIKVIDVALTKINQARSQLGAVSNRLDSTISNLTNISVNVEAARSGIMDADFAKESTSLARGKILSQASTAMLAQANSSKQNVMQLLRG